MPKSRNETRQDIRRTRRALTQEQQSLAAHNACHQFLRHIQLSAGDNVALYFTNDGELDTSPLIHALWQRGINLYLPRLHPFSAGNLVFLRYQPDTPMVSNQYGILEPKLNILQIMDPRQLDAIITPLVAFDDLGNRMGMGGGYYDRTLSSRDPINYATAIGYAHNCQQVECLATEHWDIPLEMIVTPNRVFDFR